MVAVFGQLSMRARWGAAALVLAAGTATGQAPPSSEANTTSALNLPSNPQLFGTTMPSVVKATAIVNGEVITQTDIDQRLALLVIANGGQSPAEKWTAATAGAAHLIENAADPGREDGGKHHQPRDMPHLGARRHPQESVEALSALLESKARRSRHAPEIEGERPGPDQRAKIEAA